MYAIALFRFWVYLKEISTPMAMWQTLYQGKYTTEENHFSLARTPTCLIMLIHPPCTYSYLITVRWLHYTRTDVIPTFTKLQIRRGTIAYSE